MVRVNLYVGTFNGYVYHFVLEKNKPFLAPEYMIASKHVLLEGKPVKSILLLPQIACVALLCGGVLFFFSFPELSPRFGLYSIKGVIEICQDLDKLGETETDGSIILTILTKKKIKRIKVKDSILLISDIDYSSPITACQKGSVCCIANNLFYELIDFENNRKIPLFPILQESDTLLVSSGTAQEFNSFILSSDDKIRTFQNDGKTLYQNALNMLKKYLLRYRKRKKLGSMFVSEKDKQIFEVVDLALLKLLLYLSPDKDSSRLYELIDSGIECFDNAVIILEENRKYFLLKIPLIRDTVKQSIINYREFMNDKLSYFEYMSTCMIQSDNEYKEFILERIKLIELFQSTSGYDLEFVLKFLYSQKDLLVIELVILYGRSAKHEEALTILIQTLRDYKTSEIYCYHRGLSIKLSYDEPETEELLYQRRELFQLLLDKYLKLDYDQRHSRVSLLLGRWGIYLDAIYVLKVISGDCLERLPQKKSYKEMEIESSFHGYEDPLRLKLELIDDRPKLSLWGNMIGKDVTNITLPVSFNEALSLLQRVAEDMEYIDLVDTAVTLPESCDRMLYVAAFAISEYSSTINRVAKPFNPLLGETYEYCRPDKCYRFLVEQVSHHPPISAAYAESPNWEYWGESRVSSKFCGRSFDINPLGTWFLKLRNNSGLDELYTWKKVTTSVVGIITGLPTVDNFGEMLIKNHTIGDICSIDFKKRGWRGDGACEIKGIIRDRKGVPRWSIGGHWNDKLYARRITDNSIPSDTAVLLWQVHERPPAPFNLTSFAITLNALPKSLKPWLPPTDTRLRPDQRAMENGRYEFAAKEKERLEHKQRSARKERELKGEIYVPRWFCKSTNEITGDEQWLFNGEYWKLRETLGSKNVKSDIHDWGALVFSDFLCIIVVNLKQEKFTIDNVDPRCTILQVKEMIQESRGHDSTHQKLVYSGKVLSDNKTVESYNIKEKDFIVCMVQKPKQTSNTTVTSESSMSTIDDDATAGLLVIEFVGAVELGDPEGCSPSYFEKLPDILVDKLDFVDRD
ncbi:hypothetical protein PCK2_000590 [Pneumocystis canis]|nr:hypothetical protein PCK2_000590 [Pneumocystis canis]